MFIDPKWVRYYAIVSSAVMTKIALTVAGFFLGSFLDRRFHTYPFLTLLGVVIGVGLGLAWVIYVATRKFDSNTSES